MSRGYTKLMRGPKPRSERTSNLSKAGQVILYQVPSSGVKDQQKLNLTLKLALKLSVLPKTYEKGYDFPY